MTSKKEIILTADDFGIKETYDNAILDCFLNGFLTSACVCSNTDAYEDAIKRVLPKCIKENGQKLDLGVHLNIIEGKSLTSSKLLTDNNGYFNNGFLSILLKSYNSAFLKEVEREFRTQIERILNDSKEVGFDVSFINSHVHIHAIPKIFELTKRLASEYNIPFIRTQNEIFYTTPKATPSIINIIKILILKIFTLFFNHAEITNKYIAGVGFTGDMGSDEIYYAAKRLTNKKNFLLEILIHPDCDTANEERFEQYSSALNLETKKKIEELGFVFTTILDFNNRN